VGSRLVRVGGLSLLLALVCPAPARAGATDLVPVAGDLVRKAAARGTVPVIVQLAVPAIPEGHLPDGVAVGAQRRGIVAAQGALVAALSGLGHRVRRQYASIPYVALDLGVDALTRLAGQPGLVAGITEDVPLPPLLAESVPLVEADRAQGSGFTGAGMVIAVLDTGVDASHPFLAGRVVQEACFAVGQDATPGAGDCPNGLSSQVGPGAGGPCSYAVSGCRHGTHVAGIAAGAAGPIGPGVASGAGLMSIRVFSRFTGAQCGFVEDPCALSWSSDQIAGLESVYALRHSHQFAAVNMSLGGGAYASLASCDADNPAMKAAIDNLRSVGIATVIASGNTGFTNALSRPACISSAVSVGSTADGSAGSVADRVSMYSNSAPFLSLLAPGELVTSSVPGGGFATFQGTSMAAPHVAGAWALLKQARPAASVGEVLAALQGTGHPIVDPRNGVATARIRLLPALDAILAPPPIPCPPAPGSFRPGDFDGDGRTDLVVYRRSAGAWLIRCSSLGMLFRVSWGSPFLRDEPVAADYDGDGTADIAVYRQASGEWLVRQSKDGGLLRLAWGSPFLHDRPVPADYDGDGRADLAVYRQDTGQWLVRQSSDGSLLQLAWGSPFLHDRPVPADYDGDGRADLAVYRQDTGQWLIRRSTDGGLTEVAWGAPVLGDVPVPGDYDGDARADIAVYRVSTGRWFIRRSGDGLLVEVAWGAPALGDTPVPGDYDGDGRLDIAIYRTIEGAWYLRRSSDGALDRVAWGAPALHDVPAVLPSPSD
jgi:subtilisin family serine protease